jgi:hypothetical protein
MTAEEAVERFLRESREQRAKAGIRTAIERILDLPHQDFTGDGEALVGKWTALLQRGDSCDLPLRPIQAIALEACAWAAQQPSPIGMVGNIGVGKGKTLMSLLIPEIFDAENPLIIVPPSMRGQLEDDIFMWSQHYKFRVTFDNVLFYSDLSRPEATGRLREIAPDLIICDEAHYFRHSSAARTKRFIRYIQQNPDTRVVLMSGTLTGSTLSDYAHLCEIGLREFSPLPTHDHDIEVWGSVLNVDGEPDAQAWRVLSKLNPSAAKQRDVDAMRQAFYRRFATAPGVVSTTTSSCDAALELHAEYPEVSEQIRHILHNLENEWVLPDGTDIIDATHFHRALGQLSLGFYYVWDWPNGEVDEEWLDARRGWASGVRSYLKQYAREGCDSPFLVEEYVRETGRPGELAALLARWDEQRHKPEPPTKAIWLDVAPVLHAVEWAAQRERAFIWYHSRAVGDMLESLGIPVFRDGGQTPNPEDHPIAALSITVFNKGRNFQAWSDQLVMEVPTNGATWQQLLGRTHRQGQRADTVTASIYQHTWPLRTKFDKALDRARYAQGMTGEPQKLLQATRRF